MSKKIWWMIGIGGVLFVLFLRIAFWLMPPDLEPWEQTAVDFWSDFYIKNVDTSTLNKYLASNSAMDMNSVKREKFTPGTIYLATGTEPEINTPTEKAVIAYFPPNVTGKKKPQAQVIIFEKVGFEWKIRHFGYQDNVSSLDKLEKEDPDYQWKEVDLE